MNKDLRHRLLVAVVGIPLCLFIFYTGGIYLQISLGLVALTGIWEYKKILFRHLLGLDLFDLAITSLIYLWITCPQSRYCSGCLLPHWFYPAIVILVRSILWYAFRPQKGLFKDYFLTFFGLIYCGIFTGYTFLISVNSPDNKLVLLLIIMIWIADSAAYFIGMKYGKHRGIIAISPNKSAEGFIAGLLAPFMISGGMLFWGKWSMAELMSVAFSAGCCGQLGDLLESKLKRIGGVKDSSNLIPGHGGILDRFDSLLLAGPVLLLFLKYIR